MNDLYDGREQTGAKHDILKIYLESFSYKIIMSYGSLDFIDGFSGPWKNVDMENLSDTSIGISLKILSDVVEKCNEIKNKLHKVRCIFNEKNSKSYTCLENYIERSRDKFPLIDIKIFKGDFSKNATDIKNTANNKFQLLFVDPTGFTGFSPSDLKIFGDNEYSEIIVNFMRSHIERFISGDHSKKIEFLKKLVGEERTRYLLDIGTNIKHIEMEYLEMLRNDLNYKFAGFSPIYNPKKEQVQFSLAFATNHPKGMNTLRDSEVKALLSYDQKRSDKKYSPEGGLFDRIGENLPIIGSYDKIRKDHLNRAGDNILNLLSKSDGLGFDLLSAFIQQDLYIRQTEIKDIVVNLTKQGKISDSWKIDGSRKPKKNVSINLRSDCNNNECNKDKQLSLF